MDFYKGKKGDTLLNFAFIIGLIFIAAIVILNLNKLMGGQTKELQKDIAASLAENIKETVEKAQSSPNDADFLIKLPYAEEYDAVIDKNTIKVTFTRYNIETEASFFSANLNVLKSSFSSSGIIHVYKQGNNLLVTNRLICNITDKICDPGCVIEQVCDPECYKKGQSDVCNPYCIGTDYGLIVNVPDETISDQTSADCEAKMAKLFPNWQKLSPNLQVTLRNLLCNDKQNFLGKSIGQQPIGLGGYKVITNPGGDKVTNVLLLPKAVPKLDGICDPDCYSNDYKGGIYDPDCIVPGDGICDPGTNNIKDGICDTECLGTNGVCDPDCKEADEDCPHQDNGICEVAKGENCEYYPNDCPCSETEYCGYSCAPLYEKHLLDDKGCMPNINLVGQRGACSETCECLPGLECDTKYGSNRCCPPGEYFDTTKNKCINPNNDGKCNTEEPFKENCLVDTSCTCYSSSACCPTCSGIDNKGCCPKGTTKCGGSCKTVSKNKNEKDSCECSDECTGSLQCNGPENDKHCCPSGTEWDGTQCKRTKTFIILYVQLNGNIADFENKAEQAKDHWIQLTSLSKCPEMVDKIARSDLVCSVPNQGPICQNDGPTADRTIANIRDCANSWGYADYTRIVGVLPGPHVCQSTQQSGSVVRISTTYGYTLPNNGVVVLNEETIVKDTSHELGHTFGLCDEGYGNQACSLPACGTGRCSSVAGNIGACCPNVGDGPCLMCSQSQDVQCSPGTTFALDDYAYLAQVLSGYCG